MKKRLIFTLLIVMAMLITACGGDANKNTDKQDDTTIPANAVAYADSKTGKYLEENMNEENCRMKFSTTASNVATIMDVAVKGQNSYVDMSINGQSVKYISAEGNNYFVDDASKLYYVASDEFIAQTGDLTSSMFNTTDMKTATVTAGTKELNGKSYESEQIAFSGVTKDYLYDNDALKYIVTSTAGQEIVMEIFEISSDVPDTLFQLPEGYTEAQIPAE